MSLGENAAGGEADGEEDSSRSPRPAPPTYGSCALGVFAEMQHVWIFQLFIDLTEHLHLLSVVTCEIHDLIFKM